MQTVKYRYMHLKMMSNLFGLSYWCLELDLVEDVVVVVTVGEVGDEVAVLWPPVVPVPAAAMSIWPVDSAWRDMDELKPLDSTSGVDGAVFTLRLKKT